MAKMTIADWEARCQSLELNLGKQISELTTARNKMLAMQDDINDLREYREGQQIAGVELKARLDEARLALGTLARNIG